jgi:hypothetical protein
MCVCVYVLVREKCVCVCVCVTHLLMKWWTQGLIPSNGSEFK